MDEEEEMAADVMTKLEKTGKGPSEELQAILRTNIFKHAETEDNIVKWTGDKILLLNPKQKEKSSDPKSVQFYSTLISKSNAILLF